MKFKNLAKKLSVFAVGLGLTLGSVFGFAGCNPESSSSDEGSEPPVTQPEEPTPKESISFADFIKDHSAKAVKFVKDEVQPDVVLKRNVKSQSWSINANSSDELTEINIVYTYSVDKAKRAVEIAQVTLNTPVDLDEIVDGTYNITKNSFKIDSTTVFEFDAKNNYDNQNVLDALYTADGNAKSTVKVYNEVESTDTLYRSFEILKVSDSQIKVDNIAVKKGDGSLDDLLYYLSIPAGHTEDTKSTYNIDGTNIYSTSYTLEDIENSTPDPEEPDEPTPPVTDSDIVKALNDNCKEGIVKRCRGLGATDLNKVEQGTWYVSKDAEGNITQSEFAFNYANTNDSHIYYVGKVVFDSPVRVKDLQNGNLGNANYTSAYSFNYNPEIQSDREDLTNAICETIFGINNDAKRLLFIDSSYTTNPELGEIGQFTVIEITEKGIEKASVNIKYSSNDEGYLEKLENEKNYNITATTSYNFEGQKLTA